MTRSRYDDIHDEYFSADIRKSGTRYERLAAAIQKVLAGDESTVIHDCKLRGESDVAHQIDVTVERASVKKRILVECKDFNVSGDKVGLGIIRDFWGVVDDVRPDAALVLSTEGFTKDAQKFAAARGIGLRILREYTTADDRNRIHEIHINIEFQWADNFRLTVVIPNAEDAARLETDMQSAGMSRLEVNRGEPISLNYQGAQPQLLDFLQEKLKAAIIGSTGDTVVLRLEMPGATITVGSGEPIPMVGMVLSYELATHIDTVKIVAESAARMILDAVDSDEEDVLIFDSDLRSIEIDDDGVVLRKK